tara:strand:+ start:13745 stop:14707 length:963 start_codon:yes stop_codon:yes gene_type:complete
MLLSKTPLRISFAGGGSDYFNENSDVKGRVIVTTINKYMHVILNKKYNSSVRVSYSKTENVNTVNEIKHQIIRQSLKNYNIINGVEVVTVADIPTSGSGLASSSALTVGLVNILNKFKDQTITKKILAQEACKIEIIKCKKLIGMQDQYSTAYGGLNRIEFYNKKVTVKKIELSNQFMNKFNNHLHLFHTGINRQANDILLNIKKSGNQFINYDKLAYLAKNFEKELFLKNLDACGEILNENWMIKKKLDQSVSSLNLDNIYDDAKSAGAIGGKLLGAGGGGYFLFLSKPQNKNRLIKKLKRLQHIDFKFTQNGSEVIKI